MTCLPSINLKEADVDTLNELFTPLSFEERIELLYEYFDQEEVLCTSSFGTHAAFMLHLIHRFRPTQKIYFIDTTYHFKETLDYKQKLEELYGLNIVDVLPDPVQNALTRDESWWIDHPKMCCTINKIAPLDPIVAKHKVWISGLKAYQTEFRSRLRVFEKQGDIIKFHPIIDVTESEYLGYLLYHGLPPHPLESQGFGSVGCTHCTHKGEGREGRWKDNQKTECGLHPNFFLKKKMFL
jgi:phosphoadenosine phosphosulfate reductase